MAQVGGDCVNTRDLFTPDQVPKAGLTGEKPVFLLLDEQRESAQSLGRALQALGFDVVALDCLTDLRFPAFRLGKDADAIVLSTTFPSKRDAPNATLSAAQVNELMRRFPLSPVILVGSEDDCRAIDPEQSFFIMGWLERPLDAQLMRCALARVFHAMNMLRIGVGCHMFRHEREIMEEPVARIVHDLNNQITGIKGGMELFRYQLTQMPECETKTRFNRYVKDFIEPGLANLERMIAGWRQMRQANVPSVRTCDLPAALRQAIIHAGALRMPDGVRLLIAGEPAPLTVRGTDPPSPFHVEGALQLIVLALTHVIHNALEAVEDQADRRVEIRVDRAPDGLVCVQVHDSGPGIPEALEGEIWRSFFTTKDTTHVGIGLSVAKQIIDKYMGRIACRRSPMGGTCVEIFLAEPSAPESGNASNDNVLIGNPGA